jgi:copper homeostasis protein
MDVVRELGADVVVLGLLNDDDTIDETRTAELVRRAENTPVTFHLAFDRVPDQFRALDTLIDLGVTRVLTSGASPTALAGVDRRRRRVDHADGRISIMAGGRVRGENAAVVARDSGVREVHARCERDPQRIRAIVDALAAVTGRASSDYSRG